ncbi:transcriptional regulator [Streptomyces viridiviolaceus]|uniref:IclR family transcriptional regulator n=1 Tax=Streptomyces viridiviolaceus TaxID=68282 RepID=A0ABW2EBG9_9ACTN|nr:helix-turn-helix domain-containing protein [Streptomyces viridiviolaceus]GHB67449.1 transcriptional regulator [Streptomyces viridiviolaceus]
MEKNSARASDAQQAAAPRADSKTLDKGIRILKALASASDGLGVAALSREVEIHRTVAYRLLGTLERHGMVRQETDGRYQLGLTIVELSGAARSDIRSIAHEPLRTLADRTHSTAILERLDGTDTVCLMVVEPGTATTHVAYQIGLRRPATSTPSGASLLGHAASPDNDSIDIETHAGGLAVTRANATGPWSLATPVPRPGGTPDTAVAVVALEPLPVQDTASLAATAAALIGERMAALGPLRHRRLGGM